MTMVLAVSMILDVSTILSVSMNLVAVVFVVVVRPHPQRLGIVVFVVPRVLSPKGNHSFFLRVLSPKGSWGGVDDAALVSGLFLGVFPPKGRWGGVNVAALASGLFLGVLSPKGSWGGQCCRARQQVVPWVFVPQGNLGRRR